MIGFTSKWLQFPENAMDRRARRAKSPLAAPSGTGGTPYPHDLPNDEDADRYPAAHTCAGCGRFRWRPRGAPPAGWVCAQCTLEEDA
jgi:hypothetical protein